MINKLLVIEEWDNIVALNDGISEEVIFRNYADAYSYLRLFQKELELETEIFYCAITLFYYYNYFNSFRNFKYFEICPVCIFCACKLKSNKLYLKQIVKIHNKKFPFQTMDNKSIINLETKVLKLCEFQDTDNPIVYLTKYCNKIDKDDKELYSFSRKLLTESFLRPIVVHFNVEYIAVACILIAYNVKYDKNMLFELNLNHEGNEFHLDYEILCKCIKNILNIYNL